MSSRVFSAQDLALLNDDLRVKGQPAASGLLRYSDSFQTGLTTSNSRSTSHHLLTRFVTYNAR